MKKVNISKEELEEIYLNKKLSSRQIAKLYGVHKNTILNRMKKFNILPRTKLETSKMIKHKIKYKISKKELINLYHNKKWSMQQIAEKYGCYNSCIYNKMKKYQIETRSFKEGNKLSIERRSRNIAKAINRLPKNNFSKEITEKAYLIGFRIGDLHVFRKKYGQTIYVSCWTTKKEQLELMCSLFCDYGSINIIKNKKEGRDNYGFHCHLNNSFSFLIKKEDNIPRWIRKNKEAFLFFLAGYIDAEGSFGVYNKIGEFSIGSYDKNILFQISDRLDKFKILTERPRLETKKGHVDKRGVRWNGDLWKIKIRRMRELYKFIFLIKPILLHKKRRRDLFFVKQNLLSRKSRINLENEKEILCNDPNLLY